MERGLYTQIKVDMESDHSILTIKPWYGGEIMIENQLGKSQMVEMWEWLRGELQNFQNNFQGRLVSNDYDLLQSVRILQVFGSCLYDELFPDECERQAIDELFDYFKIPHTEPGVIELILRDVSETLPLEFMLLPGTPMIEENIDVGNRDKLTQALSGILGFSSIIKRTISKCPQNQNSCLNNSPKLPMKLFYDCRAPEADKELNFFRDNCKHFALDGPDTRCSVSELARELAHCISDPTRSCSGETEINQIDQIHHFYCHCLTNKELTHDYELLVCGVSATIKELKTHSRGLRKNMNGRVDMPLVFLNACGAAVINPLGLTSFTEFFLVNRNRGFIGTETDIPGVFASRFSQYFYYYLLKKHSLGEALYKAKWDMIEYHKNPLGILYTLYADPDIKVNEPRDLYLREI